MHCHYAPYRFKLTLANFPAFFRLHPNELRGKIYVRNLSVDVQSVVRKNFGQFSFFLSLPCRLLLVLVLDKKVWFVDPVDAHGVHKLPDAVRSL